MRNSYLLFSAIFVSWSMPVSAENIVLAQASMSQAECADVMQSWAEAPKSVAQDVVDQCRQMLNVAPAAGAPDTAAVAAVDPCSGPDASGSVFCWGPWAGLAPAAGGAAPQVAINAIDDFVERPELADDFDKPLEPDTSEPIDPPFPELPLGACDPGVGCGFATVVDGSLSDAPADETEFAGFALASDGTAFTVDPDGPGEIASVTGMSTDVAARPDEFEQFRANGVDGDQRSRLIARVIRNGDEIEQGADVWTNGDTAGGPIQSGYFAWGQVTSQADLDTLNSAVAARSISFSGPMSVDNSTIGSITVNFGSDAGWSGNWTNPGYSFDAGGPVGGPNFISSPDQFSNNVVGDSYVQGVLLGGEGNRGVAHIVDVQLNDAGRIKDIGLLREVN